MKPLFNVTEVIGQNYPSSTGRLKRVGNGPEHETVRVALIGDSTIDNGYWIQKEKTYAQKTATVTHQVAKSLSEINNNRSYLIANFAVDGATTSDLNKECSLNKVLPTDEDHKSNNVNQLKSLANWRPDMVIVSIGGNNYREALQVTLRSLIKNQDLISRHTPDDTKLTISLTFNQVKQQLLEEYKKIIDSIIDMNPQLSRIVMLSQYYPELTQFTRYMIYTGFSHIARSQNTELHAFETMEATMNELYREVGNYALSKGKQVVFTDMTSSISPLGGNHTMQIEPNQQGAKLMGQLIANAIDVDNSAANYLLKSEHGTISRQQLSSASMTNYSVKPIEQFINEDRYKHVSLFFSKDTSLTGRFEYAYHILVGKQFDAQYTGCFAFGLLDFSLITILANYLLRVALDDENPSLLKTSALAVSLPIIILENIVAATLLIVLAAPIKMLDLALQQPSDDDEHVATYPNNA